MDEGLGFAFGFFRLNSLLAPVTFAIPLLITLGLLYLFQKTRQRFVLIVFNITALLWWGVGIGLQDGFYNHTLSVLLYLVHMPPQIMSKIYPTYPTYAALPRLARRPFLATAALAAGQRSCHPPEEEPAHQHQRC